MLESTVTPAALAAVALVGVLGGGHCLAMCGGIVAGLAHPQAEARADLALVGGYQLGRILSYSVAGAIAGGLGSLLVLAGEALPVQRAMFAIASIFLVALGVYLLGFTRVLAPIERVGGRAVWDHISRRVGRYVPARNGRDAVVLGALWGWVPCGLVYSVLATAAAAGSAAGGAQVMLAFGLGTLPAMMVAGAAAQRLARWRSHRGVRIASGLFVAAMGIAGLLHLARHHPVLETLLEACGLA